MRVFLLVALAVAPLIAAYPNLEEPNLLDEKVLDLFLAQKNGITDTWKVLQELAKGVGSDELVEDAVLTTPELITKYGYPAETHEIVTEDGYILTYHRIPYGKNSETKVANSRPLILQHGLMSSSDDWIVTGPGKGFGYILADAGYDVWIGNARGNKWSHSHTTLDSSSKKFWEFSFHEMGVYDLPAAIDYILEKTGQDKLQYVGHSLGTSMFVVMGAAKPAYNKKIRSAALLAPIVYNEHTQTNAATEMFAKYPHLIDVILTRLGIYELLTHPDILTKLGSAYCKDGDATQPTCISVAEMAGVNSEQLNATILPAFLGHFPSGSATKVFLHMAQGISTGEFRQYDHGTVKNLLTYSRTKPPKYSVKKVTAPVALYYAENDGTVQPEDVLTLAGVLKNVISVNKVDNEKFNHLDFILAIQAKELVYDNVISELDKY